MGAKYTKGAILNELDKFADRHFSGYREDNFGFADADLQAGFINSEIEQGSKSNAEAKLQLEINSLYNSPPDRFNTDN